jgi:hypothetical protein
MIHPDHISRVYWSQNNQAVLSAVKFSFRRSAYQHESSLLPGLHWKAISIIVEERTPSIIEL